MEEPGQKNRIVCDYSLPVPPGKVCDVDVQGKQWGECTKTNDYGFTSASPCIFLKLNRVNLINLYKSLTICMKSKIIKLIL